MNKQWKELYSKIPEHRRQHIESYVHGMVARFKNKPLDSSNLDWRNGWGEADQIVLGEQVLNREAEFKVKDHP